MKPDGTTWNRDAERAVLAAVMMRPDAYDVAGLEPADFLSAPHQAIWRTYGTLRRRGAAIDPVTVGDELERLELLAAAGGLAGLGDLLRNTAVHPDNVDSHAQVVRRDSLTRRVHREMQAALSSGLEGEELLGRVLEATSSAAARTADDSVTMDELVLTRFRELGERLDAQIRGERARHGVPTGFARLDENLATGGLPAGHVTVLGGRPSDGKSSLARSIADNASAAGYPVHVFSLEDDLGAYADRAISDHAQVDLQRIGLLSLQRGDMAGIAAAADALNKRRNWRIDDLAGLSSAQIAMRVRRWKRELGTRLVVVDYVQIIRERDCKRAMDEVEKAIATLVELARNERVAVLLLSQLTRANVRENRRPVISDLRETGKLEQDAHTILFVHQEREDERAAPKGEVIVAKQKNGRRDVIVRLAWDAPTATYRPRAENPW